MAGNCYPVVLLTQRVLNEHFRDRAEAGARSLVINLSSQMSLAPVPSKRIYSASKYFDHTFTTALGYECKKVDVLSVMPGFVATNMSGFKQPNPFKGVISAEQCAQGILANSTSHLTFGGRLHEVLGLLMRIALDVLPLRVVLSIVGKQAGIFSRKTK